MPFVRLLWAQRRRASAFLDSLNIIVVVNCVAQEPNQNRFLEGISERYPKIGDSPKMVISNPPEGSIEPRKRFYRTPFWPPKRFYRTPVKGLSEPQKRFYRTFCIEPPPFQVTLLKLPLFSQEPNVEPEPPEPLFRNRNRKLPVC